MSTLQSTVCLYDGDYEEIEFPLLRNAHIAVLFITFLILFHPHPNFSTTLIFICTCFSVYFFYTANKMDPKEIDDSTLAKYLLFIFFFTFYEYI